VQLTAQRYGSGNPPEARMTMNIHWARPACYLTTEPTPRGQVSEGWKDGAKRGLRNPFWEEGRICGNARREDLWQQTLYTHQVA